MTTSKLDPIIITDDPITVRPPLTPYVEFLSIDVVLMSDDQLQLRLAGTTEVLSSTYAFYTGCARSFSARFTFRGGRGCVRLAETSASHHDDDGDGVVELTLASPGEHTLEVALQPLATAQQHGIMFPSVPTTKVVLRPDTNCPQPKSRQ